MNPSLLEQGDSFTHSFSFSQEAVNQFAIVTGDSNPIHLDKEFAAQTVFKKPIMHGFLSGSVFSKILGTMFPGEGTIYLKQEMKFLKPMFVDTEYEAVMTIKSVEKAKHKAIIETKILEKASQSVTLEGEAVIINARRV